MKYLGIDYGTRQVGIAKSDDHGLLAFPHTIFENKKTLISNIREILTREHITAIVLGDSSDSAGKPNKIMPDIIAFKKSLEKEIGVNVYFEPEFFTSIEAEKMKGHDAQSDARAAALILQRYLDRCARS